MTHSFLTEGNSSGSSGHGGWPKMAVMGTTPHVTKCENCGRAGLHKTVVCVVLDSTGAHTSEYHYFGSDCASKIVGKSEKDVEKDADDGDRRRGVRMPKPLKPSPGQLSLGLQYSCGSDWVKERFAAQYFATVSQYGKKPRYEPGQGMLFGGQETAGRQAPLFGEHGRWNEQEHPRASAGQSTGGQFVSKEEAIQQGVEHATKQGAKTGAQAAIHGLEHYSKLPDSAKAHFAGSVNYQDEVGRAFHKKQWSGEDPPEISHEKPLFEFHGEDGMIGRVYKSHDGQYIANLHDSEAERTIQHATKTPDLEQAKALARKFAGVKDEPEQKPAAADSAESEEKPNPRKWKNNGDGTYTSPNGTVWRKAKEGGEISPVTGKHFKGGALMPIHGLHVATPKAPKSSGSSAESNPNENKERPKFEQRPVRTMTPEQIEQEKIGRERQRKWDEISSGPFSQIIGLKSQPHSIRHGEGDIRAWMQAAESAGPEKTKAAMEKAKELAHRNYEEHFTEATGRVRPGETPKDAAASQLAYALDWHNDTNKSMGTGIPKKRAGLNPHTVEARFWTARALDHGNQIDTLHQIHSALTSSGSPTLEPTNLTGGAPAAAQSQPEKQGVESVKSDPTENKPTSQSGLFSDVPATAPKPAKPAPVDNTGGRQDALFAGLNAKPGQMNLFDDAGVPDDLLGKKDKFSAVGDFSDFDVFRYAKPRHSPGQLNLFGDSETSGQQGRLFGDFGITPKNPIGASTISPVSKSESAPAPAKPSFNFGPLFSQPKPAAEKPSEKHADSPIPPAPPPLAAPKPATVKASTESKPAHSGHSGHTSGLFDESAHPRWQKGDHEHHGGQFAPKGEASATRSNEVEKESSKESNSQFHSLVPKTGSHGKQDDGKSARTEKPESGTDAGVRLEIDGGKFGSSSNTGGDAGIPDEKERIVTARKHLTRTADRSRVPESVREHLSDHQQDGVALTLEAMEKNGGFLLADGTGVGKTRQQLAVAKKYLDEGKKVLVIAPKGVTKADFAKGTVSGSWKSDSEAMGVPIAVTRDTIQPGKCNVTTYENLIKIKSAVDRNTVVIFDESHALKNFDSARAGHGVEIADKSHAVLFATATPVDKVEHLHYLGRTGIFGGQWYGKTYQRLGLELSDQHVGGGRYVKTWKVASGISNKEVMRRLSGLFDHMTESGKMVKRELSMAKVPVHFESVKMPPEAHEMLGNIQNAISGTGANEGLEKARILMAQRLQQEPHKIPTAVSMAHQAIKSGRQVVIFAARVNDSEVNPSKSEDRAVASSEGTMKLLRENLISSGIDPSHIAEIHGGIKPSEQPKQMQRFQDGSAKVVIATIASGGTGINLDDSSGKNPRTMIVMTAPFSAVENVQAAGRVWRLKTKSIPEIKYLWGDTEVDDWNKSLISRKMKTLGAAVAGESGKLDVEELDADSSQLAVDSSHSNPFAWNSTKPAAASAAPASQSVPAQPASEQVVASSKPAKKAIASWSKLKSGDWGLRIEGDFHEGDRISVTNKAGKSSVKTIGKTVWKGDGVALVQAYSQANDENSIIERFAAIWDEVFVSRYSAWSPQTTRTGRRAWRNVTTGEVRYQDKEPESAQAKIQRPTPPKGVNPHPGAPAPVQKAVRAAAPAAAPKPVRATVGSLKPSHEVFMLPGKEAGFGGKPGPMKAGESAYFMGRSKFGGGFIRLQLKNGQEVHLHSSRFGVKKKSLQDPKPSPLEKGRAKAPAIHDIHAHDFASQKHGILVKSGKDGRGYLYHGGALYRLNDNEYGGGKLKASPMKVRERIHRDAVRLHMLNGGKMSPGNAEFYGDRLSDKSRAPKDWNPVKLAPPGSKPTAKPAATGLKPPTAPAQAVKPSPAVAAPPAAPAAVTPTQPTPPPAPAAPPAPPRAPDPNMTEFQKATGLMPSAEQSWKDGIEAMKARRRTSDARMEPTGSPTTSAQPAAQAPTSIPSTTHELKHPTLGSNQRMKRWYNAGRSSGSQEFSSPAQMALYDYGANESYKMRGGRNKTGDRAVRSIDSRQLASQLGIPHEKLYELAMRVHNDVRQQMRGFKDGEHRMLKPTSLVDAPAAPAADPVAPAAPPAAPVAPAARANPSPAPVKPAGPSNRELSKINQVIEKQKSGEAWVDEGKDKLLHAIRESFPSDNPNLLANIASDVKHFHKKHMEDVDAHNSAWHSVMNQSGMPKDRRFRSFRELKSAIAKGADSQSAGVKGFDEILQTAKSSYPWIFRGDEGEHESQLLDFMLDGPKEKNPVHHSDVISKFWDSRQPDYHDHVNEINEGNSKHQWWEPDSWYTPESFKTGEGSDWGTPFSAESDSLVERFAAVFHRRRSFPRGHFSRSGYNFASTN